MVAFGLHNTLCHTIYVGGILHQQRTHRNGILVLLVKEQYRIATWSAASRGLVHYNGGQTTAVLGAGILTLGTACGIDLRYCKILQVHIYSYR